MELFFAILASIGVSILSLIGGILLFRKHPTNDTTPLVGFAAGVMLTTAIFELIPEAIREHGEQITLAPVFLGIIVFFFLERFIVWFHHHDDDHAIRPTGYLILLGDTIHNVIDGVSIAGAFLVDVRLGVITTLAIAAHEIPQELADLGILIHAGFTKINALLYNLLSGFAAVGGAIGGYVLFERLNHLLPLVLGFTGGMFLYIALSDLIPELHRSETRRHRFPQTFSFLLGIAVSYLLIASIGHSH